MPAKVLERDVQAASVRWLRNRGAVCIKQATTYGYGAAGWPDYLVLVPCRPPKRRPFLWWIEFKVPGGVPTARQQHRIDELRAVGCRVDVVDDPAEVKRIWREIRG